MIEPTDPKTLEALRGDWQVPAPEEARARIASRLGIAEPPPGHPAPEASVRGAARWGGHHAAMLLAAFLAGGAAGMALQARLAGGRGDRSVVMSASAPPVPSQVAPSAMTPMIPVMPRAPEGSVVTAPAPTAVAGAPDRASTQLDAERSLLDLARVALVRGDGDGALGALDRHARTFRRPLLGEERDALVVQALVRAGRYDEAHARADEFRRKTPKSLLAPAVEAAIASIP
jgi:hypothetical protein